MLFVQRSFDELVNEAATVSVEGWDFSWLDGRATEQRPSWGYQRHLRGKLAAAAAALDIQTGGGEVLAGAGAESFPRTMVATEGWAPNVVKATTLLHPLGVVVVAAPGGTYFAQHVGAGTNVEISEYFLGPLTRGDERDPDVEADQARAAGLEIVQCRNERLQLEFFDVGAMVFFLRRVVWTVPDFAVERYRDRLRDLHEQIDRDGVFRSTMSRTLFEARKPAGR
jgi:hypothetical protein